MATRSASSASATTGAQSTGLPASSSRDAGPQTLLGPLGLLGRRSGRLLDAVDVAVLLAGHEPLGRPGAVALDPDRRERVVPSHGRRTGAPAWPAIHSPRRCLPPGRNGSSTRISRPSLRSRARRSAMAWPTSPTRFSGDGPCDVGGVAGQDGDVVVEEERDERLEVEVVGPEGRVGGPHQGHHPAGGRGGQGTVLLLLGRPCPGRRACCASGRRSGRAAAVVGSWPAVSGSPRRGWRR